MKKQNQIKFNLRIKEIVIDYVIILVFLSAVLLLNVTFYFLILGRIPELTMQASQIVATVETVVPVILIFSILDYRAPYGSCGKRKVGLKLIYIKRNYWRSLLRNAVKFLPWQLAHIGVIEGIYTEFSTLGSIIYTNAGILLALILFGMGVFRKDKRHLGDLLAGTQVVQSFT
ncbi:RDD family protein [Marinilactibacillus sp. XAAS-LB27]|uniref:RDD family protein n=1 Tax=Marinilactibacillus sp. XAAS-LB27 TaxID=3114538 RepID=UPI002E18D10A|nr:RDD family protein [Marinilactibacillus sp. XAAS-LB27]